MRSRKHMSDRAPSARIAVEAAVALFFFGCIAAAVKFVSANAVTIGIDPYVIIRPEGRWHVPGALEDSANRDVSRPSIKSSAA